MLPGVAGPGELTGPGEACGAAAAGRVGTSATIRLDILLDILPLTPLSRGDPVTERLPPCRVRSHPGKLALTERGLCPDAEDDRTPSTP